MKKSYVKKIIKEEIHDVIHSKMPVTEQLGENEFQTYVKVDMDDAAMIRHGIIQNPTQRLDVSIVRGEKVVLKWKANMEYRSWGIKEIYPFVPNQKITVYFENDSGETPEQITKEIEIQNVEIEINKPDEMFASIQLYPHEIEIYDDEVKVYFTV